MTEEQRASQASCRRAWPSCRIPKPNFEEASKSAQDPWRDLAQAMFNLKEFIYLR